MKIGIVGTGTVGSVLAKKLADAEQEVKVTNTKPMSELKKIATDLGAQAASLQDLVNDVDVIIFSMPYSAYKGLPKDLLKDVPEGVVVIDTSNYYPMRDGEIPELKEMTESDYIASILNRPIVKMFNNILQYAIKNKGKAAGADGRIAIAVAGDNDQHKKIASQIANIVGFDTVDNGTLAESWRQQPGTPAYCTHLNVSELKEALSFAIREKSAAARDRLNEQLVIQKIDFTKEYERVVALNREIFYQSVGKEYKAH